MPADRNMLRIQINVSVHHVRKTPLCNSVLLSAWIMGNLSSDYAAKTSAEIWAPIFSTLYPSPTSFVESFCSPAMEKAVTSL